MKKIITAVFLIAFTSNLVQSQVPEKFNYQGVLRDASGELITNTTISLQITLLVGSSTASASYIEEHEVQTNNYGQFAIQIGNGTNPTGTFSAIDWSSGQVYLKTEVDETGGSNFSELSTVQLITVPYALYAKNVENNDDADPDPANEIQDLDLTNDILTITNNSGATEIDLSNYIEMNTDEQDLNLKGDTLFISGGNNVVLPYDSSNWVISGDQMYYNGGNVGIGSSAPVSNLEVKSSAVGTNALFQVINANNDTVFAVYPDGVKVFVNPEAKGKVGGFAVSGRSPSKVGEVDYMRVTYDSTRIYVNDDPVKAKVGGFAVSGRSPSKGVVSDYLVITGDSTRIYVNDTISAKAKVGGFAVSGRSPSKGAGKEILFVSNDSTRVYINESGTKAKVGGFAVSGRSPSKGESNDYFNVSGNASAEIVNNEPRVMWYPKKAALLAGEVHVGSADSVGTNSIAMGYRAISKGEYSQAMGFQTYAIGNNSTAIGNYAEANGDFSFALGGPGRFYNWNTHQWDTAYAPKAISDYSYALGMGSIASKAGAVAIGALDTASGFNSLAMGYQTRANGTYSTAMGIGTRAMEDYSTAIGMWTEANGKVSFATGYQTQANGTYSTAMGFVTEANGSFSTALGSHTKANGKFSFATGSDTKASGDYTTAIGCGSNASGDYSIAIGHKASTNQYSASFVFADRSDVVDSLKSTAANQFMVRAAGGTIFYSNSSLTSGVSLSSGGGAWASVSDKNKKENFQNINKSEVLEKLSTINIQSWNYKSQDPSVRHIGITAQDFYSNFGFGESDTTLIWMDVAGINMIVIQELDKKYEEVKKEVEVLKADNKTLKSKLNDQNTKNVELEQRIHEIETLLKSK